MSDKVKLRADLRELVNSHIAYGQVDSSSTSTVFTATVPNVNQLVDGTTVMLRNGIVTSAAGFTLNVNGLGAKPVYSSMSDATADTTIFNINYTMLFVYDSTRITGGCWICYRGYNSNDNTIGYQIRTNSTVFTTTDIGYRYRLWLQTDEGKLMPVNTSTSTNATANRSSAMNTREFWLNGKIIYNSTKADYQADVTLPAGTMWQQYNFTLGYSFNNTGKALTLTSGEPLYMVATDEGGGKGKLASPYYTQTLPSTEDNKLYIYLGHMTSAVNMELALDHPIFEYKDNGIRLYRDTYTTAEVDTLLNGKSDTGHTHTGYANSTHTHTKNQITDFPTLSTVATTGSYNDLSDKPNIPEGSTVDTTLSGTSNNAIANSAVKEALDNKLDKTHTSYKGKNVVTNSSTGAIEFEEKNNHTHSQYLTEHQSLSNYVTNSDSRLSDARTPLSHSHGNLQNNGQVGSTVQANKNVVTDGNGLITTEDKPTIPSASSTTPSADTTNGSVGNGTTWARSNHTHPKSSLYAEATHTHNQYLTEHQDLSNYVTTDDSRLSDARTPTTHTHTKSQITDFPTLPTASSTVPSADTENGSYGSGTNYARANHTHPKSSLYAESSHTHSQYLTEHQSLTNYVQKNNTNGLLKNDGTVDTNTYLTSHQNISGKEETANKTSSWNTTTNNTRYPTEKLVKDSLDGKLDKSQTSYKGKNVVVDSSTGNITFEDKNNHTHNNYLTSHQDITGKEDKTNKSSSISTDTGSTTKYPTVKAVENYAQPKGNYLTSHQDISGKANISDLSTVATSGSYSDLTNKPAIPSKTSDLQNDGDGTNAFITQHQSLTNYLQQSDVKNNLTSTDTNKPLSANQGKELKTLVDGKANSTHSHNDLSQSIQNLGQTINGLSEVATSGDYNDLDNKPNIPTDVSDLTDTSNTQFTPKSHTHDDRYYTESEVDTALNGKQSTLVSGSNIKTVNNESLLGNGNLDIRSGGSYLNDFYRDSTTKELIIDYTTYTDLTGSEIVTSWSSTPTDIKVPSEKLVKDTFDDILDLVYPVGSIYMSVNSTSPATLFGGTWEQIKDTFLLASGNTYNADPSNVNTAQHGEATQSHTHTQSSHRHHYSRRNVYLLTGNGAGAIGHFTDSSYDDYYTDWQTPTINSKGGGEAHNNMPPYLAVYMWKRTA